MTNKNDNEEISSNTILGHDALLNNTNLGNNTAIGFKALRLNGDGFQNTSIGSYAIEKNIKSHNNTGVGYKALSETLGEYNTGVGALCGQTLKTGVKNVLVGKHADVSQLNANNQIVIGQGAVGLLDNSVTLGNVNVNNVFMSQDKTAHVHCGNLSIYDEKSRKVYSLPRTDGEKGFILRTNGKGLLTWVPNITVLNGLEDCTTELLNKNMFIGFGVGAKNTPADGLADKDGKRNTALGLGSFADNTTGKYNVCFGSDTLNANTTGNYNVAMGHNSLTTNIEGNFNVAMGYDSLRRNTTGVNNVAIGSYAGDTNTEGTNNTCIGDSSSVGASQTYSIALGSNASVSDNHTMVIGGSTNVGDTNNTITSILPGKNNNTTLGSADKKFENIVLNLKVNPTAVQLEAIPVGGLYVTTDGTVKMKQ